MPVKQEMIFGPFQETSYTAITLNSESNFSRREKNHSLFHWNTLMSPELHIRIWMLSRSVASMIIGISMGQEMWLFVGQASLNLFYCKKKPPDGYMWSGGRFTRKQLTSRPDHLWPKLWDKMGKNAKLKEKEKWSHEKLHLDNARKSRWISFIDPEDKEFKETIKNARKKLETPVALAMPCKSIKSNKNCGSGASNKIKTKLACILGSQWIYKIAYGRIIIKISSRPYCRKSKQFTTALQFGAQIYSYASGHENSNGKSSGGQGMGKIGEIFSVEPDESQK